MKSLYDWQTEIANNGKRILEDEGMLYLALFPRTGKTPITLEIIKRTYAADVAVLFVTTKSAIPGIYKVIDEFGYEDMKIHVVNYESLHKVNYVYDVIVLDEAHAKISKFPKPSKSYKELKRLIDGKTDIIYLSGTPKIESNSKLFHQLSLCPNHPWRRYKSFYEWHSGYSEWLQPNGKIVRRSYDYKPN